MHGVRPRSLRRGARPPRRAPLEGGGPVRWALGAPSPNVPVIVERYVMSCPLLYAQKGVVPAGIGERICGLGWRRIVRHWRADISLEINMGRRVQYTSFSLPRLLAMLSASRHPAFLDTNTPHPPTADPAALSSLHIDPAASSNVVFSPSGTIHVLGYTPSEGERGVPITVRIHFQPDGTDALFVRLVVGQKAIATKVRELPNYSYGRWQLDANIPANDPSFSPKVLLSVQALNDKNEILDSVTFGEFSYWSPGTLIPFLSLILSCSISRPLCRLKFAQRAQSCYSPSP
jgi:hypothetical protein